MNAVLKNNGKEVRFDDECCKSLGLVPIHYKATSALFNTINIELTKESQTIKKMVEQKKFLRKTMIELEETIVEYTVLLTYKPYSYQEELKTISIKVMPGEEKIAKDIVNYISSEIDKKRKIEQEKQNRENARLQELKNAEQKRLEQCIYDVVVIDFETTGIKSPLDGDKYDEIVSVSIIDQDGNILMNSLCKPQKRKTWAKAQEIHGISPAMVKNQPSFEEVFPKVKEILYKSKIVIAYNIDFEMRFLWGFDLEFGKPGGTQLIRNVVWGPDPMLMYCAYKGIERWQKLSTVAKHFKFKYDAHDSLEDVKATLYCYKKLIEYASITTNKDYIIKYGFGYDSGKKGRWLDLVKFDIMDNAIVDFPDCYKE